MPRKSFPPPDSAARPLEARYYDLDGRLVELDARPPVELGPAELFNSALLYGFGTYETFYCDGGRPAFFDAHYRRLTASLRFFGLPAPAQSPRELYDRILALTTANDLEFSRLRLDACARGMGDAALSFITERAVPAEFTVADLPARAGAVFAIVRDGRYARDARRIPAYVKSGAANGGFLAGREVKRAGAEEAIVVNYAGHVCEGSFCNLFWIKDDKLFTPALSCGLLDGIARDAALMAARKQNLFAQVVEAEFRPEDLLAAEAVFLTSSVRGPWPITGVIDGAARYTFPAGHPGLAALRQAYFAGMRASFDVAL